MQYRITTTGKIPRMIKNAINTYSLVLDILQSLYRVSFSFLQFACFIFPISMSTIHRYHSPCRNRPLRVRDPWGDAPATKSSGWPRPKAEPRSGRKGPREHAERKRVPSSASSNPTDRHESQVWEKKDARILSLQCPEILYRLCQAYL